MVPITEHRYFRSGLFGATGLSSHLIATAILLLKWYMKAEETTTLSSGKDFLVNLRIVEVQKVGMVVGLEGHTYFYSLFAFYVPPQYKF